jgi:CO dehydrogenase maturation factor
MKIIAITGKGGTGKTTIAAFIVRWLSKNVSKSILAVDADSNVNLNDLLGVEPKETIGGIREEMKSKAEVLPGGMTKHQFLEYKIQASLVETPDFDLIAMGRPEGPGCYCYANNLLRDLLKSLSDSYDFVVIDNEAGMEHLSRRTVQDIDSLLVVSDPSVRGIRTAGKISRLLEELRTRVKAKYLVLNRLIQSPTEPMMSAIGAEELSLICSIPADEELLKLDQSGMPLGPNLSNLVAYQAVEDLMIKLDVGGISREISEA